MERNKSFFVTKIHTSTIVQQNKVTQCSNVNFHMLLSTWLTPGTKSFYHYQMTWYISIKYKLHAWPHSIQCRAKRRKYMFIRVEQIDFRSFTLIFQLPLNPSQHATQYINVVLCQSMLNEEDKFLSCHINTSKGYFISRSHATQRGLNLSRYINSTQRHFSVKVAQCSLLHLGTTNKRTKFFLAIQIHLSAIIQ